MSKKKPALRVYSAAADMTAEELKELKAEYNELKASGENPERLAELSALGKEASAALKKAKAPAKSKKDNKSAPSAKALRSCFEDMVKIMLLEDTQGCAIEPDGVEDADLAARILEEAKELQVTDFYPENEADPCLSAESVAVLTALGVDIPAAPVVETPKKEAKKAPKKDSSKKENTGKKGKGIQKVGVVSTIVEILKGASMTRDEVVEKLAKKFPDREPKSMKNTLNSLISKAKQYKLVFVKTGDNIGIK